MLTWATGDRHLICRVCGVEGHADLVAEITALDEIGLEAVRCPRCGSIQLSAEPRDFSPTRSSLDTYIESGAGIGAIAQSFAKVRHTAGMRFLDVGCSYPFALDLARFLYGWDVLGVEPSPAARRGSRELGVEVRSEFLAPGSRIGANFDVILASEVIEHVTEPLQFLEEIRDRLAPGGTVVLTTPAAEIVNPLDSQNEVLLAISPGYHVFVASVKGMELLLARAGFGSFSVVRDGGSLRVTARVVASSDEIPHQPVTLDDLDRYYDWRGNRAKVKSALALGMLTRLFRLRVARGDFASAARVLPRLNRSVRAVHRVNLRRPATGHSLRRIERNPPWSIIGASFALGMYELLYLLRAERAAAYFQLCETIAIAALAKSNIVDGDAADLMFQAPFHRALALAQYDPGAAAALAMELPDRVDPGHPRGVDFVDSRRCRIYTDLVSRGSYRAGHGLDGVIAERAAVLANDNDVEFRTAGLDAVFSIGMATLNTGNPIEAVAWFSECLELSLGAPASTHTSALIMTTRVHIAIARDRIAVAPSGPSEEMESH
jgi:SAM-dependent methyltransferase